MRVAATVALAAFLVKAAEPLLPTTKENADSSEVAEAVGEAFEHPDEVEVAGEAEHAAEDVAQEAVEGALPIGAELRGATGRPTVRQFAWAYGSFAVYGIAWAMCCMGQPRALSLCRRKATPAEWGEHFTNDVGKAVRTVAEATCCWGFMWVELVGSKNIMPYTAAACIFFLVTFLEYDKSVLHFAGVSRMWTWLVSLVGFTAFWALRVFVRRRVRGAVAKPGGTSWDLAADGALHCCCIPCAVTHEALIVELHADYAAV